jgi:hypothetical protein
MNTIQQNRSLAATNRDFTRACVVSCQKIITQIKKAKDAILAEFRGIRGTQEQLLRLALNEAEALAWQTEFPHLVFPALATEKAQALSAWESRQRLIRHADPAMRFAA